MYTQEPVLPSLLPQNDRKRRGWRKPFVLPGRAYARPEGEDEWHRPSDFGRQEQSCVKCREHDFPGKSIKLRWPDSDILLPVDLSPEEQWLLASPEQERGFVR